MRNSDMDETIWILVARTSDSFNCNLFTDQEPFLPTFTAHSRRIAHQFYNSRLL